MIFFSYTSKFIKIDEIFTKLMSSQTKLLQSCNREENNKILDTIRQIIMDKTATQQSVKARTYRENPPFS